MEILRQLETEGVPSLLLGYAGQVETFSLRNLSWKRVQVHCLNRPRYSGAQLRVWFYRKYFGQRGEYSDTMLKLARQKATALLPPEHQKILVNFPHAMPPPQHARGFAILVHDLNWRHFPDNFKDAQLADRWCRGWAERAERIITNSEFTRREIMEHYGCSPDKIVAAPLAPFAEALPADSSLPDQILTRLDLATGKFFFFPSGWGVHKGFDVLTQAMDIAEGADPVVVTCGNLPLSEHWRSRLPESFLKLWEQLTAQKKLIVTYDLSEEEMQALRLHCRAFVLPNQFEGYGFPLAEAIYHHRPVIVSDIAAHREILDRYPQYQLANLFPPGSAEMLAAELSRPRAEVSPIPDGWHQSINTTWSWQHAPRKIIQAMS